MKVLLLAAGYGKRLRPITNNTPKCLVQINNKPLITYWLELLKNKRIDEIYINTNYLAKNVEDFFLKNKYSQKINILKEKSLLGTGGTILKILNNFENDTFLVIHADNLSIFDLDEFLNAHHNRPQGTLMTMMIFKTDNPQSCGIVELDKQGIVKGFHEKVEFPPSNLANAAVYIVEPSIREFLLKINKEVIDFSTEVIPHFINQIFSYENTVYHRDIGTIKSYRKAQKEFPIVEFNHKIKGS